jgi:nicotinate-nucleotide adenylyltransferase
MTRIGIYSGAFDPVHDGHVAFAREAQRVCGLDKVIFLPERSPRGKADVTDIVHRETLLRMAVRGDHFGVLTLSTERFTVHETLPELMRLFVGCELTLLAGSDVAQTFCYRWPGIDALLAKVSLAIGMREGDSGAEIHEIMRQLQSSQVQPISYRLITSLFPDASSSSSRQHSRQLHPEVRAYAQQHRLYL